MSSQPTTVTAVIALPPGNKATKTKSWVNGSFDAIVTVVKAFATNTTLTLVDPANPAAVIAGKVWGRDCAAFHGMVCNFSGAGMSREEYNGTQEVSISEKCAIQVMGRMAGAPAAPPPAQAYQAPAPAAAPAGGSQQAHAPIHGATVGMALNQACGLIKDSLMGEVVEDNAAYLKGAQFPTDLHQLASTILRVSTHLEAGHLAPKISKVGGAEERVAAANPPAAPAEQVYVPPAPAPAAPVPPHLAPAPNDGAAFPPPADDFDEDVPF